MIIKEIAINVKTKSFYVFKGKYEEAVLKINFKHLNEEDGIEKNL